MRNRAFIAASCAVAFAISAPASADTIANFTLDNVTFNGGAPEVYIAGTATGGFTLDLTTDRLSNVDITTSTPLSATYTSGFFINSPATFDFMNGSDTTFDALSITLSVGLTPSVLASPDDFSIASGTELYRNEVCDDEGVCEYRLITGGSLDATPTPIPTALPLFAAGLGAMGLLGWRRKRKNAAAAA
jgi:hypothetical protein